MGRISYSVWAWQAFPAYSDPKLKLTGPFYKYIESGRCVYKPWSSRFHWKKFYDIDGRTSPVENDELSFSVFCFVAFFDVFLYLSVALAAIFLKQKGESKFPQYITDLILSLGVNCKAFYFRILHMPNPVNLFSAVIYEFSY
jgi:hypothetical protein